MGNSASLCPRRIQPDSANIQITQRHFFFTCCPTRPARITTMCRNWLATTQRCIGTSVDSFRTCSLAFFPESGGNDVFLTKQKPEWSWSHALLQHCWADQPESVPKIYTKVWSQSGLGLKCSGVDWGRRKPSGLCTSLPRRHESDRQRSTI